MAFYDTILGYLAAGQARLVTRKFFAACENATSVQDALLQRFLQATRGSDFARRFGLDRVRTYDDYVRAAPVQTYEQIRPFVDDVRAGRVEALFTSGTPILMFALTSGTTAQPKYIPVTKWVLDSSRQGWNIWGVKAILDHPGTMVRHIVQVTSPMDDHFTPAGIPCGAITGLLARNQKRLVRRYYTSPPSIARIPNAEAKYYTIMRLAVPRDVAWLVTANPATLLLLAKTANEYRETLIRDIHDGALSASMDVPDVVRASIRSRLKKQPAIARRLEQLVKTDGGLYPKRYWNLGFRAHWLGGSMGLYESQFPEWYGDTPARDIGLIASEGRMSIPVDDGSAAGVLAVRTQFYEFIPEAEYGRDNPTTLRSHEVEPGAVYFIVLTNGSGLYRYDMGDRVRVTGWRGQAPTIEFLSRDAHSSSMAGEKLTEDLVVQAMRTASADNTAIEMFVLAPRFEGTPNYRLYVDAADADRRPDLAARFEAALVASSVEYADKRKSLRLAPVEVVRLSAGFLKKRDNRLRLDRARTAEQFKHQYLLPRPNMDEDLAAAAIAFASAG
ncbi:MAG: GH3 auxin-responsive promoter family protein [Phycisphaerales bacterium]|nr:GH3 auxin-responsive promoter family protein [Phycisphaerales bacterium]